MSIPSSIPFRSTRPRWQFGNKHARILARGSGSRRPNLRLKWKIGDGKIGRRHPSKQISFQEKIHFPSRMIRDRCVGVTRWGRKRTDFALLQGDPSLSSLSPVSKRGKNRALTVRWSRMDAWINRGCDWQVFGRRGQRHLDTQASKRVVERKEWSFRKVALHFISSRTNVDLLEKFHLGPISYPRKRPLSCKQPRCSRILLR